MVRYESRLNSKQDPKWDQNTELRMRSKVLFCIFSLKSINKIGTASVSRLEEFRNSISFDLITCTCEVYLGFSYG